MNIDFRCQYQYFDGIIVMIIIIIIMAMENVARKPNLIVAWANRYRGLSQFLSIAHWLLVAKTKYSPLCLYNDQTFFSPQIYMIKIIDYS